MDEVFEFAKQMQAAGQFSEAEQCYRRYLEDHADSFKALNNLGVVLESQDRIGEAIEFYRKAVDLVPRDAIPRYNLGHAFFCQDRFDSAASQFQRVLEDVPDHGPARLNLGIVQWRQGDHAAAEEHLRLACRYPEVADDAHLKLGLLLFDTGHFEAARDAHFAATEKVPSSRHYFHAAVCERTMGQHDKAAETLRRAIDLEPESRTLYEHLTRALIAARLHDEAHIAFTEWDSAIPGDPICAHMRAAFEGDPAVDRCSADYVRETFTGFAADFDETLKRLQYNAPQSIVASACDLLGEGEQFSSVLDAGCGTGLCGPRVRPACKTLTGVDLAEPMLAKARALGVYDDLVEADLLEYMLDHEHAFDLVIAADTFNYFGELQALFTACATTLTHRGYLVFSLEQCHEATREFALKAHGRFEHERGYVEKALEKSGFAIMKFERFVLRKESGKDVVGWLVQAQKV